MASKKASAAAATNGAAAAASEKPAGLPLFFKKPVALEKVRHAKAGVRTKPNHSFAKQTNSVVITALEFLEISKHYPIVFTDGEQPMPLAILGLEAENYFVKKDGSWEEGAYVPAYIRQYPFIFFENAKDQKFFLCIDEESPHFDPDTGKDASPLFNKDGSPSPLSSQALEFCTAYYRHHAITKNFVEDLAKHQLLAPYHSQVSLKDGRKATLTGFRMIDESAFNKLSDDVILEFRKKGWLPFIYLALSSASNWNRLAARANAAA